MLRLMLGFFAGLTLGCNWPKLALKGSKSLRRLADRLDRLAPEHERVYARRVEGEKDMTFKAAA
jgi:hypothetical protein